MMALWLQDMYLELGFVSEALTDKNVDDIHNFMRKSGSKNADWTPNRRQHVPVIAQENLNLAVFLFHHWWKCTFDWKVTGVPEDTVDLLAGQKRLKDEYKDPNVPPKVNKAFMAEMMEFIKEYLRSCCSVKKGTSCICN